MIKNTLTSIDTNILGKRIQRKIVVFQSDDWGTIRTPKTTAAQKFIAINGYDKNAFLKFDTLETQGDLINLFDVLKSQVDYRGVSPIFTTNHVVGNPDFQKIESVKFEEYFWESSFATYNKFNAENAMETQWQQGILSNLISPEFHSREHVDFILWLKLLREKNTKLREAFDLGFWGIPKVDDNLKNRNLMATYDSFNEHNRDIYLNSIKDGIGLFKSQFSKSPSSFIPNNYIFPLSLMNELEKLNFSSVQGMKYIYFPKEGKNIPRKQKRRIQGNSESPYTHLISLVRNVQFEPALVQNKLKTLDLCLNQIKWSFFFGKPAIIDTHRINYVGGLSEINRDENLKLLKLLIESIIKNWPDVEFESTENVSKLYTV